MGILNEDLQAEVAKVAETSTELVLNSKTYVLVSKPITPLDMQAITRVHRDFASNPNMEGMVDLLIRKARIEGANGPAFDKTDKPFLMRLSTNIIGEIFRNLFGDQLDVDADEDIEEKKGN